MNSTRPTANFRVKVGLGIKCFVDSRRLRNSLSKRLDESLRLSHINQLRPLRRTLNIGCRVKKQTGFQASRQGLELVSGVRLIEAKPEDLCPTQMTVGMTRLLSNERSGRCLPAKRSAAFLPASFSPQWRDQTADTIFSMVITSAELSWRGVEAVYLCPVEDFSHLDRTNFGKPWNGAIWSSLTRSASGALSKIFLKLYEIWRMIRFAASWRWSIGLAVMERIHALREFHSAEYLGVIFRFASSRLIPKKSLLARELLRKRASSARWRIHTVTASPDPVKNATRRQCR